MEEFDKQKEAWVLAMTDKELLDKIWNGYRRIQELTLLSSGSPDIYSSPEMKTAKMILDAALFIYNERIESANVTAHDKSNMMFLNSGCKFD